MSFMPIKASFFSPTSGCTVMRDYLSIVRAIALSDEGRNIFNFGESDLLRSKATIVPLWNGADAEGLRIVGGLHFCLGETRIAHIKGVVVDPGHRGGAMRQLLLDTMGTLINLSAVEGFALEIRIYPDGSYNKRAFARFASAGFVPERTARIKIEGTDLDRHLLNTVEEDGCVRCLRMLRGSHPVPVALSGFEES